MKGRETRRAGIAAHTGLAGLSPLLPELRGDTQHELQDCYAVLAHSRVQGGIPCGIAAEQQRVLRGEEALTLMDVAGQGRHVERGVALRRVTAHSVKARVGGPSAAAAQGEGGWGFANCQTVLPPGRSSCHRFTITREAWLSRCRPGWSAPSWGLEGFPVVGGGGGVAQGLGI